MLDTRARRLYGPIADRVAATLAAAAVPPLALTAAAFAAGVGACLAILAHAWTTALALWLANRVLDGLDGPVARRRGATDLGGFLDIVSDFAIYAGFVVALAIAVPDARIACVILLSAYYVSGTAFLALSALLERHAPEPGHGADAAAADGRSLRFVGGLAEGTETVIAYSLFCLLPAHTAVIAWAFAAMVAVTAAQRIVLGVHLLRPRVDTSSEPAADRFVTSAER